MPRGRVGDPNALAVPTEVPCGRVGEPNVLAASGKMRYDLVDELDTLCTASLLFSLQWGRCLFTHL